MVSWPESDIHPVVVVLKFLDKLFPEVVFLILVAAFPIVYVKYSKSKPKQQKEMR